MFPGLSIAHWITLHGLVTAVAVLFYVVTSHVMHQRRQPTAAIAWMMFILLLPYLALPAYLTFGSRKLARPRSTATRAASAMSETDAWAIQTIVALGQPAPSAYHDLSLHQDGLEARNALLATLDAAHHSIAVCTFILARDDIGEDVLDRLCDKARSGVRVRLLLDGMGRLMGGRPDLKRLTEAGGAWEIFVPPLHSPLKGRTNLRIHRKLVVTDAAHDTRRMWAGGRNLATEYFEGRPGAPAWRDLSFDLGGPLVAQASSLFERDWAFANGRALSADAAPRDSPYLADGAQLVASGPDQIDDTVYALLVTAAYRARRSIALVTPYFVPESSLLMALCLAARRGVAVDLLLPERSNHRLSDLARSRALRSLVQAGGRVWLAPGMLHAKLAVIDDALALAGSVNLDSRSLFLNYELMVAFHKVSDVRRFEQWFGRERASARAYVATPPGLMRDVAEGMLLWLGFQL
jgi:cardiolipin synthase A/B